MNGFIKEAPYTDVVSEKILVYLTYKVSKIVYGWTKLKVTMYSKYSAHVSSNGNHFLTAGLLVYLTYRVCKIRYGQTKLEVTMYSKYTAHVSSNGNHFLAAGFLVY